MRIYTNGYEITNSGTDTYEIDGEEDATLSITTASNYGPTFTPGAGTVYISAKNSQQGVTLQGGQVNGYNIRTGATSPRWQRHYVKLYDSPTTTGPGTQHFFSFDFKLSSSQTPELRTPVNGASSAAVYGTTGVRCVTEIFSLHHTEGTTSNTNRIFSICVKQHLGWDTQLAYNVDTYKFGIVRHDGTFVLGDNLYFTSGGYTNPSDEASTYYRVEAKYDNTTSIPTVELKINGNTIIGATGVTNTTKSVKEIRWGPGITRDFDFNNTTRYDYYFLSHYDNIRINNNVNLHNNDGDEVSWCDEGYVGVLPPISSLSFDWPRASAPTGAGTTNNWSYVDDDMTVNPTTDFLRRSSTRRNELSGDNPGQGATSVETNLEMYTVRHPSTISIPWNALVNCMGVGTYNGAGSNVSIDTRCAMLVINNTRETPGSTGTASGKQAYFVTSSTQYSCNWSAATGAAYHNEAGGVQLGTVGPTRYHDWAINGYGTNYDKNNLWKSGDRPGSYNFIITRTPYSLTSIPRTERRKLKVYDFGPSGATGTDSTFVIGVATTSGNATIELNLAAIWLMIDWTPLRKTQAHFIDLQPS